MDRRGDYDVTVGSILLQTGGYEGYFVASWLAPDGGRMFMTGTAGRYATAREAVDEGSRALDAWIAEHPSPHEAV